MSYLNDDDPKILEDINKRKEFYSYKIDKQDYRRYEKNIIPRFMLDEYIKKGRYLQLHSYQLFVKNFINPNTPYSRLLLKWETGIGKTIGSLSIAFNFINYYTKEQKESVEEVGTVFVIGFSERVFKKELLRFPELGFISRDEYTKLQQLKKIALSGSNYELEKLREFIVKIKKRFSNRKGYGFFKFIGYKAFVNRLFSFNEEDINFSSLSEEEIYKNINNGKIKINEELLNKFHNSLIICDEIHNTYNSLEKNNWGNAIQYVLNNIPSVRALFMSATPLNNSPTEIIDLLNLLIPKKEKLNKDEYFTAEKELKPGALEKIGKYCQGRVSFLRDVNPKYFPRRRILGDSIPDIDYLKFIRCPMSKFHYKTYEKIYKETLSQDSQYLIDFALPNPDTNSDIGIFQTNVIKKSLNYASQKWKDDNKINYVNNKIVGNFLQKETLKNYSSKYYEMIKTLQNSLKEKSGKTFIYHNVVHVSGVLFIQEVLLENGFIDEFSNSHENTLCVICGNLRKEHNKKQLSVIKGGKKLDSLTIKENSIEVIVNEPNKEEPFAVFKKFNNKILLPAGRTNFSTGKEDLFKELIKYMESYKKPVSIQVLKCFTSLYEILENKGYSCEESDKFMIFKKKIKGGDLKINKDDSNEKIKDFHYFKPARFVIVHSEIEKNQIDQSLEKFNHPDNILGHNFSVLIGSRIIKESHDFKGIKNIYIMGRPDNIPILKQIIGRAIRKNSHIDLPPNMRNVDIRIFTSCLPIKDKKGIYKLSYEETKYKEKIYYYKIIQNIEKVFHENAIDSIINKDTIKIQVEDPFQSNPKEVIKHYNMLPYKPNISKNIIKTFKLEELNLSTFDIYHYKSEINFISIIIKRLFLELSPIWNYKDLFEMVKFPPFSTEINTKIFSEDLFSIALSKLIWNRNIKYSEPYIDTQSSNFIEKILNPEEKYILIPGGSKSVIVHVGDYYILFPIDSEIPILDIEYPYRIIKQKQKRVISLQGFMDDISTLFNYEEKRNKFYIKWKNMDVNDMESAILDFSIKFHNNFIEECIKYIFDILINKCKKSKMHDFYLKMIYYYNTRNLIIWASTSRDLISKYYDKYVSPVSIKVLLKKDEELNVELPKEKLMNTTSIINMLKNSINSSTENWIPSEIKSHFIASKNRFNKFYDSKKEKIPADILPVGHIISEVPKFYIPEKGGWNESPEYMNTRTDFKENSILIGYDEKLKNSTNIRFKIRPPIQNIKSIQDTRKIERGSVCNSSKSKGFLIDIAKKLDINVDSKINVNNLCEKIRKKLIYNELKERLNPKSKIKYFYFSYEKQPIF